MLVFALIFVAAVGFGPFTGVLAVMFNMVGALGKLLTEVIEPADRGPVEALELTGAGPVRAFRYALLPDVWPNIVAVTLYIWEFNVLASTVLGIVGAGGIGQTLKDAIDLLDFPKLATVLGVILAMVIAIDTLSALAATIDTLPAISFDSQFWNAAASSLAVFNTSNQLQTLSGASDASSLTTGEVGDDEAVMLLQQIRFRYGLAPASATVQTRYMPNSGGAYVDGVSGALNDGKFDTLKAARWHKAVVDFVGPVRVTHLNAKMKPAGTR